MLVESYFNQFEVLLLGGVTPTKSFEGWRELGSGATLYCIPVIMVGHF